MVDRDDVKELDEAGGAVEEDEGVLTEGEPGEEEEEDGEPGFEICSTTHAAAPDGRLFGKVSFECAACGSTLEVDDVRNADQVECSVCSQVYEIRGVVVAVPVGDDEGGD